MWTGINLLAISSQEWGAEASGVHQGTIFLSIVGSPPGILALDGFPPISSMTMPRIQMLTAKKRRLLSQSPGTKVLCPRNSKAYARCK